MRSNYGPGWTMRVYYDDGGHEDEEEDGLADPGLCRLACAEVDLDLCDARKLPMLGDVRFAFPMVWRFFPGLDPQVGFLRNCHWSSCKKLAASLHQVDVFLSRDLDSTIAEREAEAVKEFLHSNSSFHVMRDHPAHTAEVLGGMWGAKANELRPEFVEAFKKLHRVRNPPMRSNIARQLTLDIPLQSGVLRRVRRRKGTDQEALARFFWPWARRRTMAHDAYFCTEARYAAALWRPFPTRRRRGPGNFVGGVTRNRAELRLDEKWQCPRDCRPQQHQDWTHC